MTERGALDGLARQARALLLLGGGLLAVFALNTVLTTFTGIGSTAIHDVLGPGGFAVAMLGVLGLTPTLARQSSTLGRVATLLTVLPVLGWTLLAAASVASLAGVTTGPQILGPISIATFLTTILATCLVGASILRTGAHPRIAGWFVLVPAAMFLLLVARVVPPYVIDVGHAVGVLGAGLTIQTEALDSPAAAGVPESA